ncbi:MerR family transcriptional regulator [Streptomyces griseus]|uniref:MerR-family transcriptional regulator n=1 Tax=Streptomyces griseus subsp. griseus (strain JCM 4626 / CBS 651.72 / NBRC 13350 / KCC S-0626 / ISP 5235) TaxID=455632 RepID=B1W1P4_STRGG|nr:MULTISPECIES: MerR family transcriptional regulator [Streptomyces]MYR10153.1 MerR family DNA-binding transcriptional regulator [Streptomyces sp. SID724]MYT76858.1 MerR family DNA-binding transcriptional regulator [Streptomyces sp. SID8364]MBW3704920.1 MerR family transcriptional regulator [Streptomyces griseus]NEB53822.1 MerR family transcriptional regulator [Streptomyces griseus]SBU88293.1 DNA-binding transcriptional regulator, MerR family [Streptomyces sp. MnatMP-M77]
MSPSFVPPRRIKIGDAAAFVGSTPRAIRHYHEIGLLPEPGRGGDGRRRYGYEDMIRLLWIRRTADAGIALDDIRDAFATGAASADADGGEAIAGVLERLEHSLAEQEAELRRQRAAVRRMRTEGSRTGLLSDLVTGRLTSLPEGSLRPADLDTLLVTERIFGPLGAAVQATRFIALARNPTLRQESDRVDDAEEALDDSVAVDDPRVARVAAERHAFESALHAFIEESGLSEEDEALFDAWEAAHPETAEGGEEGADPASRRREADSMSVVEAVGKMPYDFSPARLRCGELAEELSARDAAGT